MLKNHHDTQKAKVQNLQNSIIARLGKARRFLAQAGEGNKHYDGRIDLVKSTRDYQELLGIEKEVKRDVKFAKEMLKQRSPFQGYKKD